MPPLHDDIVDAYALNLAGGSVVLDTVGATMQTNEAIYNEGYESIWLSVDLSAYVGTGDTIVSTFDVTGDTGGIVPFLRFWYDGFGTFDPSAPDFSLLFTNNAYYGDGTAAPGPMDLFSNPDSEFNPSGLYWVWTGDWNFTTQGQVTINWSAFVLGTPPGAPDVVYVSADTTVSTVLIHVTIDPNFGGDTDWFIEWGTTTSYGDSSDGVFIPDGDSPVDRYLMIGGSQAASPLSPSTLYHYRVVCSNNSFFNTPSPDQTFTTDASTGPPGNDNIT